MLYFSLSKLPYRFDGKRAFLVAFLDKQFLCWKSRALAISYNIYFISATSPLDGQPAIAHKSKRGLYVATCNHKNSFNFDVASFKMVKEIDKFLIDTAGPKLCHRVTRVKSQTTSTACFYYNYCYDYYHYYCFLVVFLKIHETTFVRWLLHGVPFRNLYNSISFTIQLLLLRALR